MLLPPSGRVSASEVEAPKKGLMVDSSQRRSRGRGHGLGHEFCPLVDLFGVV